MSFELQRKQLSRNSTEMETFFLQNKKSLIKAGENQKGISWYSAEQLITKTGPDSA